MCRPAACLFDLDGLLLDTEPLHGQAWRQAAAVFELQLGDDCLMQLRGRRRQDNSEQVRRWIAAEGRRPPSNEQLLAVQQPIARQLLARAAAMPGAQQLVERCNELGVAMALVTSSSRASLALKSAPHPWLGAIGVRVLGDDPQLVAGKPAPDPFLLAAHRLGVKPKQCWAFEDSPAGARSAAAAGCQVHVLVPPSLAPRELAVLYEPHWNFLKSLDQVRLD
jgi:HAD superfamily hydrolase (TIGR01509 family)